MTSINTNYAGLGVERTVATRRTDRDDSSSDPVDRPNVPATDKLERAEQRSGDSTSPKLDESLAALNDLLASSHRGLRISVDLKTGTTIFRIVDTATGEVVMQVPSELTSGISDALIKRRGILVDTNQ